MVEMHKTSHDKIVMTHALNQKQINCNAMQSISWSYSTTRYRDQKRFRRVMEVFTAAALVC